jgi:hypothetical protein
MSHEVIIVRNTQIRNETTNRSTSSAVVLVDATKLWNQDLVFMFLVVLEV